MPLQRLDRIIASGGQWSRREVKELFRCGQVTVDGLPVRRGQEKADPERSRIAVSGRPLVWQAHAYLMLHKPAGVLSASRDRRRQTAVDLLAPELRRRGLFPAGRLDRDATGLLLLTDDGPLAHCLLSPRRHVEKEYRICVQGRLTAADCAAVSAGLTLPDGLACLPAQLCIDAAGDETSAARIILREGKFHQIKRMMAHLGKPVLSLHRLRMGSLTLDGALAPGACRPLTAEEEDALKKLAAGPGKAQNFHKK